MQMHALPSQVELRSIEALEGHGPQPVDRSLVRALTGLRLQDCHGEGNPRKRLAMEGKVLVAYGWTGTDAHSSQWIARWNLPAAVAQVETAPYYSSWNTLWT